MPAVQYVNRSWIAPGMPVVLQDTRTRWLTRITLILAVLAPVCLYAMFQATELYDPTSSYLLVPVIAATNLMLIFRVTRRDAFLRRAMILGFFAKLAAASVYLYMSCNVYNYASDNVHYFYQGRVYASDVAWNNHWPLLQPIWGANSIYMLSGALVVLLGPALQAVTTVFAVFSFWGSYLFYRAIAVAAPDSDLRRAAMFIFFFPSLLFWSACIGKDAVIALFLGMAALGFALLNLRITPRAIGFTGLGLVGTTLIRPHVAAMLSVAMIMPFLLGRARGGLFGLARIVITPPLVGCAFYITWNAQQFLEMENFSKATTVMSRVGQDNASGGSAFGVAASPVSRAMAAPVLFFRPFPWEAHNVTSLLASGEGLLLAWLVWRRRREALTFLRRWRMYPFGLFALLFVLEFCLVFSAAITNFGLLARERVMALPFLLMVFCILPLGRSRGLSQWHPGQ